MPGRIRPLAAIGLLVACAAGLAQPALGASLGTERARSFLTRIGFAPAPAEVERMAPLTQPQAVEQVLREAVTRAATPPPGWIDQKLLAPRELRALGEAERMAEQRERVRQGLELRGWWLREMVVTRSPLTERMTLFWHNHFVSAQPKVRYAQPMFRQNVLLREHALGNFGTLLQAVARDPAMLLYLDGVQNQRGQPNENFAREVMELFTVGPGRYTQADVREAARAFTGFSLEPERFSFVFRRGLHDHGEKTVLGRTGRLTGGDVLDLLLAQPSTAEFITAKLWREFVSPQPDAARLERVAAAFRDSGYDIRAALRLLLNQPELVAPQPEQWLVKSPVELAVGLVRQSGGRLDQPVGAALAVAQMGQNLFAAPSVRGWPAGEAWINTQTLLARRQFIERSLRQPGLTASEAPAMNAETDAERVRRRLEMAVERAVRVDGAGWLKAAAALAPEQPASAEDVQRLSASLGAVPAVGLPPAGSLSLDALRSLLLDPSYQLK
jgi:uncharacterized protein (DUF1800 family)